MVEQISAIATEVVAAADRRRRLPGVAVDLACGTGSAACSAARQGAQVTALNITADLVEIGARSAQAEGLTVDWRTGDAADSGLPAGGFDVAVSNTGIIFVEPRSQVAELARLIKPAGVLPFSSWVRDTVNPFFAPIVSVLGAPPASSHRPDRCGQPEIVNERLSADFEDIDFANGVFTWRFDSHAAAMT